jgi:uncharacterized membrane protein
MPRFYNEIAGKNLERLTALSDGVFAVAMTLLVLDLHAPAAELIHSEADLWHALGAIAPRLITYAMSFLTLGIFWVGQQVQLNLLTRSNRDYTWLQLGFLLTITLLPFTTALLAEFLSYRAALIVYWFNILIIGVMILASWKYAQRAGLVKPDVPQEIQFAIDRRVIIAQSLYAVGAALCVFNTYWSIGFIVTLQLIYAVGPRFRPFSWL